MGVYTRFFTVILDPCCRFGQDQAKFPSYFMKRWDRQEQHPSSPHIFSTSPVSHTYTHIHSISDGWHCNKTSCCLGGQQHKNSRKKV